MAWYESIKDAAKESGISEKRLREYVNSLDPPPILVQGGKKLLNMEGLKAYLKEKEV